MSVDWLSERPATTLIFYQTGTWRSLEKLGLTWGDVLDLVWFRGFLATVGEWAHATDRPLSGTLRKREPVLVADGQAGRLNRPGILGGS
jgi:hypothetical protein